MKAIYIILLIFIIPNFGFAQPLNDNCENAIQLCFQQTVNGNNANATIDTCLSTNINGCDDDYPNSVGFTSTNSIWFKFTTNNIGGNVTVSFSNMIFNPDVTMGQAIQAVIFDAPTPCQAQSYSEISNSETNATTNFNLISTITTPNTTYYVLVNGAPFGTGVTQPAEATFDIDISGTGVDLTPPTASISNPNTILCQGDTSPIAVTISNCNQSNSMNWYYKNEFIIDSDNFNTSVLTEDGYLKLIISCGNECIYEYTTDSIFFEVTPISVDAGEDKLIELGESVILEGTGTSNPVWSPETFLSATQTFTPTATPTETTTYFLTVTNDNCVLSDEMTVKIKELITIPSGFTPNNDHINDIWEIRNISQYPDNLVVIYDRSGQVVFKTTGYNIIDNHWDGTNDGDELPISTYFYFIDLRNGGEDSKFKGPVTILR